MVSDEPISALWDSLSLKLDELAAPRRLPCGFLEATRRQFLDKFASTSQDIFECVTVPALGTGKHVLSIRISSSFHRYATRAAKDALGIVCH